MEKVHLKQVGKAWCGSTETDFRSKVEFILATHEGKEVCSRCYEKVMQKQIIVDPNLHKRIKVASSNEGLSMKGLLEKLMDRYEK